MPFSAVFGCGNSNNKDSSSQRVKLQCFPRNVHLQNKWINVHTQRRRQN